MLFAVSADLHSAVRTRAEELLPASGLLLGWASDTGAAGADRHAAAAPTFLLVATVLFLVYLLGVCVTHGHSSRAGLAIAFLFAAAFQALALASPTMLSTDLYSYVVYGRIFGVYDGNPYLEVPIQYPGDPVLPHVYWKFVPSFYGPFWTLLSGAAARVAGEDVAAAVMLFRGIVALAALATVGVAALLLHQLAPARTLTGTVLLGWNPLIVVEGGMSGHNDLVMGLLVACGLALTVWRRPSLGIAAVVLAGLVKYVALALAPLLGLFVLRRLASTSARATFVLRAAVASLGLAAPILAATWAGPATFAAGTLGTGDDRYVNALGEVALKELRILLGEPREDTEVPLQFRGWWVATHMPTTLHAAAEERAEVIAAVEPWTELLVVAEERLGWMRVYQPATGLVGYVRSPAVGPVDRPAFAVSDPDVLAREQGPTGSPTLKRANRLLRAVGWGAFGAAWLIALVWGTATFGGVVRGWSAALLVLFYVGSTWFWPWYVTWALIPAALAPDAALSRLILLLSWGVLALYATLGFGETDRWYLETYRSLAVFGVPLLLFVADSLARRALASVGTLGRRCPTIIRSEAEV